MKRRKQVEEKDDEASSRREHVSFQLELPKSFAERHPDHVERLSKHQLIYSIAGLILGLVCILGGVALFINGVAGSTSWTAKILGAESQISDAAPGAVLFIVGLFIVLITRYVLKVKH